MPQFDTFSFFSQLFWVFVGFLLLYFSICFYLLPALGSILKIRKRKLAQINTNSDTTIVASSRLIETTKQTLAIFNGKFTNLNAESSNSNDATSLTKNLGVVSIKFGAKREFNMTVFSQAQRIALLHN